MNPSTVVHGKSLGLELDIEKRSVNLLTGSGQERLMIIRDSFPVLPVLDGGKLQLKPVRILQRENLVECVLGCSPDGPLSGCSLFIRNATDADALDLWCEFAVNRDCRWNALDLFPKGTGLNLYDVVNFRNRHFTAQTYPELVIGQEFSTTTYSDDWQFAPHPTAMILRKNGLSLFAGFLDLQPAFGMRLAVKHGVVENWDVDFGPDANGLPLTRGQSVKSGRLRLFLREDSSVHQIFSEFGEMLVREKIIADPARKVRHDWWREPIYCTWGDQWMLSAVRPPVDLEEQTVATAAPAGNLLTEEFIWKAVEVIQREKLPIRTILIDEGWAAARGDWRPHPIRFPHFRRLVDALHEKGFKVMVWWNWVEIAEAAEVNERYLAGKGWKNKHGARMRDYSNPQTQEEYLKPLMRQFFGSEADCFDLDGVKTDFLADKIHADTPMHDASWRGEEVYFRKITELFYREMRKHKPDAMHMGCAGHYWLAELIDTNRTYDVHSSNWLEHEERAKMLMCTCPGAIVSYDLMATRENAERWLESARRMRAGVQVGNVLAMRHDFFSSTEEASKSYLAMLREELEKQ